MKPTALILLSVLLVACERPFVPVRTPEIEVVAPDLSEVQTDSTLALQVRATSFRAIAHVEVGGRPLHYDSLRDVWQGSVPLRHGLNRLRITAVDEKGVSATDTAWALRLQATVLPGPPLPDGRGGGRLVRLPDGRLLFAGGAEVWTGPAGRDLFVWTPGASAFERLRPGLSAPRAGHTATLLPDGRLLLLGGNTRGRPELADNLRADAELVDLAAETRRLLPISTGAARAWHTTALRQYEGRRFLEVLGGYRRLRGDSPELGVAADLITFEFRDDSLALLTPGLGLYITPLAAHVMARSMQPARAFWWPARWRRRITSRHRRSGSCWNRPDASIRCLYPRCPSRASLPPPSRCVPASWCCWAAIADSCREPTPTRFCT